MSNEYIEDLNAFLAGELSAVETYNLALDRSEDSQVKQALTLCQASHAIRAKRLSDYVTAYGGAPVDSSGVWGAFASAVQGTKATEFDALAALEQSEAERLVQYEAQQNYVPEGLLTVITTDLLPEQHKTHLTMSTLLKAMDPENPRGN